MVEAVSGTSAVARPPAASIRPDIVVKLGGSLLNDRIRLTSYLQWIAESPARVLIMPGGGVFADLVRRKHAEHDLDESISHDMAVLATHQTGLLFHGLVGSLMPVGSEDEMSTVFAEGQQAIAMAGGFLAFADDLPRTWAATSDAIAAWLAVHFQVPMLALVKSCEIPTHSSLAQLRDVGILDPVCVDVLNRTPVDVRCFGPSDDTALGWLLWDAGGVREHGL